MSQKENRISLIKNTILLYLLSFSSHLISFVLIPYETRILQPEMFGLLGVATAIMMYFRLFVDFGFLLSATEEVSLNREDKKKLSVIFTSVTLNKLVLSIISFVVLLLLCYVIPQWHDHALFFALFLLSVEVNSLIPDYLYRGIEKMGVITVRTVSVKFFFAVLVFVFIKSPSDYILIPILELIGNVVALIGVYIHLKFHEDVWFLRCSFCELISRFKTSAMFFLSRIASTVYTATNTVVLDLISGGMATAYYSSADKLISAAKSGMSPIADSLYPYMVKNRDFKIVKKIMFLAEPMIIFGCMFVFILAKPLCEWFLGAEYSGAAPALRALLPVVVVALPNYVFGFPILGAMGLSKHANYSVVFGSVVHIINLLILYGTRCFDVVTIGIATSITESLILLYRVIVVLKYKGRLEKKDK